jgi:hypothetical protein
MGRLGKVIRGLLALLLAVAVWQAVAAPQTAGRAFNHISTGFSLSGGHAAAACETCHNGGVFKGTPRNCDGCHATGKRIVATPKSNNHIFTDAPCESCHFNTASWLGARFNHGTARAGQCVTCHNGRIATGKPTSHNVPPYSPNTCDQCHRSSAWYPHTWNHTDTTSDCVSCHKAGGPGRTFTASHLSQATMSAMGITGCNVCHKNFYSFNSARYNHAGASTQCDSCHGNAAFAGVTQKVKPIHNYTSAMGLSCQSCHKNFVSFTGAIYDHTGASTACENCHGNATYAAAVTQKQDAIHSVTTALGLTCQACHKNYSSFTGARYDHAGASTVCDTCHVAANTKNNRIQGKSASHLSTTAACATCHKSTTTWLGASGHTGNEAGQCLNCHVADRPVNHTGSKLGVCDTCHKTTTWVWSHAGATACSGCHNGSTATGKSATHIPYLGGQECSACHIGTSTWGSVVTGSTLHAKVSSTCTTCHLKGSIYTGGMQKESLHEKDRNPAATDCSASGCHRPLGTKGVLYSVWD